MTLVERLLNPKDWGEAADSAGEAAARIQELEAVCEAKQSNIDYLIEQLQRAEARVAELERSARSVIDAWLRSEHIASNNEGWGRLMLALDALTRSNTASEHLRTVPTSGPETTP